VRRLRLRALQMVLAFGLVALTVVAAVDTVDILAPPVIAAFTPNFAGRTGCTALYNPAHHLDSGLPGHPCSAR
jgi:hypothetical protein